jgi:hypothetical protein
MARPGRETRRQGLGCAKSERESAFDRPRAKTQENFQSSSRTLLSAPSSKAKKALHPETQFYVIFPIYSFGT